MKTSTTVNPIDVALQTIGGTQAQLAKLIGVTPAVVWNWKRRGYITQKYLKKAVEVTGLPANVLNPYVPPAQPSASSAAE